MARAAADMVGEHSGQVTLVDKAACECDLLDGKGPHLEQFQRKLNSPAGQVAVRRHTKCLGKGAREVANRNAAFCREARKRYIVAQMRFDQLPCTPCLPGCQTAMMELPGSGKTRVLTNKVHAKRLSDVVHQQSAGSLWVRQHRPQGKQEVYDSTVPVAFSMCNPQLAEAFSIGLLCQS